MTPARRVALVAASIALAVNAAAVIAAVRPYEWKVSALVRMSATESLAELARAVDPSFAFIQPPGHYDGVYYYAIARDPLAIREAHRRIDRVAYRYGHAGYGWLAGALSAAQPALVPWALLIAGLVGASAAAAGLALLSAQLGSSPWLGLAAAFNPGLVVAVITDTSEAVASALLLASLLTWVQGRHRLAAALLVLLCLTKEMFVLVPVGLAVWEVTQAQRAERRPLGTRLGWLALGPLAFAAWHTYLRAQLGTWPVSDSPQIFALPFVGWGDTLARAAAQTTGGTYDEIALGLTSLPLLVAAGGLLLFGMFRALRWDSPVAPVYLLLAAVVFTLNWASILFPKDLLRITSPLLLLTALLLAPRTGRDDRGEPIRSS